ncbi:hypothetical protein [Lentibacillus persicus]|nr:hypothetical protein [Lentibacillus persicus]
MYYVTGNTAEGFVNHLDTNLHHINQIIALQHPSAQLKTAMIKHIADRYKVNNIEILESSFGKDYCDGIIIREKALAFIDKRIATTFTDKVNLTETFPVKEERDSKDIDRLTQRAYDSFAEGLKIHDDLEDIYINQMDFDHADAFSQKFIDDLLNNVPEKNRNAHTYTRLFGTNTADGVVNVVPQLIDPIKHVYYIKGRAGTGKSTFMKKIAAACTNHGFDVELYYCSFDPKSIDMVLVRELDFCIFDSTDPHEFFPERDGEMTVDLYDEFVAAGTDERFATEINQTHARYKSYMKQGIHYLKKAGNIRLTHEKHYMKDISEEQIKQEVENILQHGF